MKDNNIRILQEKLNNFNNKLNSENYLLEDYNNVKLLLKKEQEKSKEAIDKAKDLMIEVNRLKERIEYLERSLSELMNTNGLMKTISEIRRVPINKKDRCVGFDALINRIDKVSEEVDLKIKQKR